MARDGDREAKGKRVLTDEQRLAWLRLIRTENVGPSTFRQLVNNFGGTVAAIDALPELSRRGGRLVAQSIYPLREAEAELARAQRLGASLVAIGEAGYPSWLAQVHAPPPLLYVRGRTGLAAQPIVAIVGARNGSAAGCKFARILADQLGRAGFVVASGFARGIDTAAHKGAFATGTIAVLAGGIDNVYPPENEQLYTELCANGLVISERPPGFVPRGPDFPRRNRLISGMSAGVIVVEAAARSGSLHTARRALEQGREVFAVPGSPLDPRAEGTNALIRQGAMLITCADDVIAELGPIVGRLQQSEPETMEEPGGAGRASSLELESDARTRVIEALGFTPIDIDEIVRATGLRVRDVQITLLELDLAGRLERHGGQTVSLTG